ncbi:hypothetical protein N7540_013187 [Penicillium herquei]|nr:hypothetical protein N7540_013187 [Penicillium herquei]
MAVRRARKDMSAVTRRTRNAEKSREMLTWMPDSENCKRYGARCGYLDKMPVTDNTPLRSHLSTFMQPNEEAKIEA